MRQRIRIRFTKMGDLQWISHHDLMRLWERALRRSGLPLAFSEGFNPRPRLSVPLALGVGIQSEDEVIEVELARWVTAQAVQAVLSEHLPPGMRILDLELLSPGDRGQVARVDYEVELTEAEAEGLPAKLDEVLGRSSLGVVRQRNQKPIDLKPYLLEARVSGRQLLFSFRVTPQGTARPEEFCALLGLDPGPIPVRVVKRRTEMRPGGGTLARPGPRRPGLRLGRGNR